MAAAASACQISSEPNEVQGADLPMNIPVYLKPSSSPNRKPSFYIPRMGDEAAPCPEAFRADGLGTALPLFSIASPSCDYYSLRLPLLKAGFRRVVPMPRAPLSNMIWGKSMPLRASANTVHTGQLTLRDAESPEQQIRHNLLRMSHVAQRFNHFPLSHSNLGCKRGMAVNICRMERRIARELPGGAALATHMYRYSPKTWFYPEMKEELIRVFKSSPASVRFIWKPARGSCGRGICISEGGSRNEATWARIMHEIAERSQHPVTGRVYKHYVVQEYLDDPLLLEGRKMDLRLYVCVTSFNPLRAYLHEEGLVRLAAEPYHEQQLPNSVEAEIPSADLASAMPIMAKSRFRHLTNYSVGRKYVEAKQLEQPALSPLPTAKGNLSLSVAAQGPELKWSLQKLWDHLDETYPPTRGQQRSVLLKEQIATLIVRTLMCAKSAINAALDSFNFPGGYIELYGFDIMLDRELNPFLIEINTLPSLESSSVFDYATKSNVAADLLNLAMIEPFERSAEQLSLVTNCPETLAAPKRHLRSAVHSVDDVQRGASLHRTPQEERAEVLSQFTDELRYARGFQCIFPPRRSDANSLYLNREAVAKDVAIYESIRLLSERDLWGLGN